MKLAALWRALGTLFALLFAVLGILLVALALVARTDAGGVTRVADRPVMTVLSDSMTPEFEAGDLIVESSVDGRADELAVGTVITFRVDDSFVTHRIVRVKDLPGGEVAYRTQGDANNTVDATPVDPDDIVGVYSWHIPNAGYVLDNVRTPMGISILVLGLALFLLGPLFAKWWRGAGDETDSNEPREEVLERAGVS